MSKKGIEDLKREYEEIRMSEAQADAFKKSIERAKKDNRKRNSLRVWKNMGTVAAAVLITFIILPNTSAGVAHAMGKIPLIGNVVKVVTFRDYTYESETQIADIDVPKLEMEEAAGDTNPAIAKETEEGTAAYNGEENDSAALTLKETTGEVNQEIEKIAQQIISEFEENAPKEDGYREVLVSYEIVASTEQYFTLKLIHYEGAGSGAQWDYYYTVDLLTGERMELKDLFVEDADYLGIISEEIIRQMREQMAADEQKYYWLDDEIEELNFRGITDDTQFYLNENNNLVISFHEGDVAPMYMGVVTFEIPAEVLAEISK